MYTSIFSRPIALNTAAQWHTGHVTGAPHREAETGGETLCLNEGRRHCMIVVVYKYQKWTAPRTSHFGGTRVNVFVRDCETLGSESERLLQHSYHILKLRQCDGTEHRKKKKELIASVKINSWLPQRKAQWSCSYHSYIGRDTQICALVTHNAYHLHL